jgi:hypothetical protein
MRRTPLGLLALLCAAAPALAADPPAPSKEEMQRQLNQQVLNSPFNAGDIDKAQAYAEDAYRRRILPPPHPPAYWVPGWTCNNLTTYSYYSYGDYQNCVYYHYYYHRYW